MERWMRVVRNRRNVLWPCVCVLLVLCKPYVVCALRRAVRVAYVPLSDRYGIYPVRVRASFIHELFFDDA